MARPTASAQCDSVASYMDGVHVKIAEAYKPPRKIALPAAYNNKLPDVSKHTYDFSLEKSVLEKLLSIFFSIDYRPNVKRLTFDKMTEWRKMRNANNEAHRIRLEEKNRKDEEDSPPAPPPPPETVKQLPVKVPPAPEATILTPQPLSPPANDLQDLVKSNGLDLRDFDNDTSSPFDNMELKTINDMEELAQVLQPTAQWVPPAKLENILKELTLEEPQEEEKEEQTKKQEDNQEQEDKRNDSNKRSVSIIVQELQRELARPIMENWKPWPDLESPDCDTGISTTKQDNSTCTSFSKLSNPLMDLSEENQKLAKHLSDMGFPLSRAARAINDLGGQDNKKVVEYLLAVQSLEEFGISGDDAEKALALTQYDQDKAKKYYENLRTLRDLGFPEDKASLALLKCNIDRDRALDFLVA